jgi:hypothetical protein
VECHGAGLGRRCWDKTMSKGLALGDSIALPIRTTAVAETGGMHIGRAPTSIPRVFALWTPYDPSRE